MDKDLINEKRYVLTEILSSDFLIEDNINSARFRKLNDETVKDAVVLYFMDRDKRVNDNWALLFAQKLAMQKKQKLIVVFNFENEYTLRRYDFLINGLKAVEKSLKEKNIPFYVFAGNTTENILNFIRRFDVGCLVTDFNPLRKAKAVLNELAQTLDIALYQVDAHNVCPVWVVSDKQEYAARTIRPKIKRVIADYMSEFSKLRKMPITDFYQNDWDEIIQKTKIIDVPVAKDFPCGEQGALDVLQEFIHNRLDSYDEKRNDPNMKAVSNLSPYLTFGFISAQRVAIEVLKSKAQKQNKEAFLEELIIRKELSDNFCFYNSEYDFLDSCDGWAKKSLEEHRGDFRPYLYAKEELEQAKTHDELWNAAQREMVQKGKMHGYMRMYWAKKILEWTTSAKEAVEIAIYLNDKYELDGCCPNGYVGILWSIGGLHDRAWFEREIFGKIRYMSYSGCKSKFDVDKYISSI